MGHSITAITLKGDFDNEKAIAFDLFAKPLGFNLSLFHINHYYTACWQHKLNTKGYLDLYNFESRYGLLIPNEMVIFEIMKQISKTKEIEYAIIVTDYFGFAGDQFANVFINAENANKNISSINEALKLLGVLAKKPMDEFDSVGMDSIRRQPEYLEKYFDLADEYGV